MEYIEYINFLFSAEVKRTLLIPKTLFGLFSLVSVIAIIYFIKTSGYFRIRLWQDVVEIFSAKFYGTSRIVKRWEKTKKRLDLPSESEHKLSIIEADNLLNEIIERMGFPGETLGDRLKKLTKIQLPSIDQVWEAHKARNNIVHDPDYRLSLDQARKVLEIYEKALQELQAL